VTWHNDAIERSRRHKKEAHKPFFHLMQTRRPPRVKIWFDLQKPSNKVYAIINTLLKETLTVSDWTLIKVLMEKAIVNQEYSSCGANIGALEELAIGKMNQTQFHIGELCVLADCCEDPRRFHHAYDIVEKILELESTGLETFVHQAPPQDKFQSFSKFHF